MLFYVDRFEDDYVFLEGGGDVYKLLRSKLPAALREGGALRFEDGAWHTDFRREEAQKKRVRSLMDELFE